MSVPLVTVILSVYKPKKEELDKTISSVLLQSMKNFELIIIKDDDLLITYEMLLRWKEQDRRIKLIDNKKNLGLITSLNKGLDSALASLIARIDVGDWWSEEKLQLQEVQFSIDPKLILCGTGLVAVDKESKVLKVLNVAQTDDAIISLLLNGKNPFFHPSVMFRKTSLRYNSNALYCEDYELWCRYSLLGKMLNINKGLTYYVIDQDSITQRNRSLMIHNATHVYCSFIKMLNYKNEIFIRKGLMFGPTRRVQTYFERCSNYWYAKAIYSLWTDNKIIMIGFFILSLLFNPNLIVEKIKRLACNKKKAKKSFNENRCFKF